MTRIDFNEHNPNQPCVGHYYYGHIIGFNTDVLNASYRVSMVAVDGFVARTQLIRKECCKPINKVEEFLYF